MAATPRDPRRRGNRAGRGAGRRSGAHDGFGVHAAVVVSASDAAGRERLIRYCARPALLLESLSLLADGRVAYQLKSPIRGMTHRVMEPEAFLARLAAVIPPPRHPLVRYYGAFSSRSR